MNIYISMDAMAWPSHTWVMGCFLEKPICFASHQHFGYLVVINQISTSFPPKYLVTSRGSFQTSSMGNIGDTNRDVDRDDTLCPALGWISQECGDGQDDGEASEGGNGALHGVLGREHSSMTMVIHMILLYICMCTYMDWYGFIIWIGLIWINTDQYGWIFHGWSNFFGAVEGILP